MGITQEPSQAAEDADFTTKSASSTKSGQTTLFVENKGQFTPEARFRTIGGNSIIHLSKDALWFTWFFEEESSPLLRSTAQNWQPDSKSKNSRQQGITLKVSFPEANQNPNLVPFGRLETKVSFFKGNHPNNWYSDVPVWEGVRYENLFPNTDLEVTSTGNQVSWRLICRTECQQILPGVRLRVEGADKIRLMVNQSGNAIALGLETPAGLLELPLLGQAGLDKQDKPSLLNSGEGWADIVSPYVANSPESPELEERTTTTQGLSYSSFLGGDDYTEEGWSIAVDSVGAAYVCGVTGSDDFPLTPGVFDPTFDDTEAFVAKFDPSGSDLVYATYLGGGVFEYAFDIVVDEGGAAYVTGTTYSPDFPTTPGAYDTVCGNDGFCDGAEDVIYSDAFLVQLNATGTQLVFSTFLGGDLSEEAFKIVLADGNQPIVIGHTFSPDYPITPGAYSDHHEVWLGTLFVTKFNSTGSDLEFSTFIPYASCYVDDCGIGLDAEGNVYVAGQVISANFVPTPGAFDTTLAYFDAFVLKLDSSGSTLKYATILGGEEIDQVSDLVVDEAGNVYLIGSTISTDFPTSPNAFDRLCGISGDCQDGGTTRSPDVFITKLDPTGSQLVFGTYLGGRDRDCSLLTRCSIAIDSLGRVYVTGVTYSPDFPITFDAFDSTFGGSFSDSFLARLSEDGSDLDYSSYLGGGREDSSHGISVDSQGSIYVIGETDSTDFPTTPGAFDTTLDFYDDAFITKFPPVSNPILFTVPKEGGSFTSPSDGVTYQIAPNTFTDTVILTHRLLDSNDMPPAASLIGINHFWQASAIYADTGEVAVPSLAFTVMVHYYKAEQGPVIEETLDIYTLIDNEWSVELESQVDTPSNIVTAHPEQLSTWAVLGNTNRHFAPITIRK
jgi:hypothetical protein